ncbi:hypothetical protein KCU78_g4043, partial [Aureobasidium melanogenum]
MVLKYTLGNPLDKTKAGQGTANVGPRRSKRRKTAAGLELGDDDLDDDDLLLLAETELDGDGNDKEDTEKDKTNKDKTDKGDTNKDKAVKPLLSEYHNTGHLLATQIKALHNEDKLLYPLYDPAYTSSLGRKDSLASFRASLVNNAIDHMYGASDTSNATVKKSLRIGEVLFWLQRAFGTSVFALLAGADWKKLAYTSLRQVCKLAEDNVWSHLVDGNGVTMPCNLKYDIPTNKEVNRSEIESKSPIDLLKQPHKHFANERPTKITDATKLEVDSSAKPDHARDATCTVRRMVVSSYPSMSPSAAAAPAKTPASKTEPTELAALSSSSKSLDNSSIFTSQKPFATPVVAEADMARDGDVVPTPTRRPEKRKAASVEKFERKFGRRTRSKK